VTSVVVLVGFMGAGKTSVGRILAGRLRWKFVDLDDRICEREARSVPEIFRDSGEDYFRRVETDCLRELLEEKEKRVVIALGGGAYVQARNVQLLAAAGVPVIFLDADPDELYRRCLPHAPTRPLLADENQFRQLYEARREGYMKAGVRIDTTALAPEQVADEVARRLDLRGYS
jgi:shikimate kinase